MRKVVTLFTILLLFPVVTSDSILFDSQIVDPIQRQAISLESGNLLVDSLSSLEGEELSGSSSTIFGNERMNIYVTDDNGVVTQYSMITSNEEIVSVSADLLDNPSMNVYSDSDTVMNLQNSDDPMATFSEAIRDEKVTYQGIGLFNQIKFGFVSFIVRFSTWGDSGSSCGDVTLYVDSISEAENPTGGIGFEFSHIHDAIEYAADEDCRDVVLRVAPGTYEENTRIRIERDTTIEGYETEENNIGLLKNRIKIKGLYIRNNGPHRLSISNVKLQDHSKIVVLDEDAETVLANMSIRTGDDFGIHQTGGILIADTIAIAKTDITDGSGYGMILDGGTEAVLRTVILNFNEGGGLQISGDSTKVYARGLSVTSNKINQDVVGPRFHAQEGYGPGDGALEVSNGALLLVEDSYVAFNQDTGLLVFNGGRAHVRNTDFRGAAEVPELVTQTGNPLPGTNIAVAQGIEGYEDGIAALEIRSLRSEDAQARGLQVTDGLLKAVDVNLTSNGVGFYYDSPNGIYSIDVDCLEGYIENNGLDVVAGEQAMQLPDVSDAILAFGESPRERADIICASVPFDCTWC